jgi:germacradienol/geosmin synthase
MPYQVRLNPHLDTARRESLDWSGRMGMYDPLPQFPGRSLWDARRNEGFDFALCAAGIDPDASSEELTLSAKWLTWGTYADDYFPAIFGPSGDMAGAKVFNERLSAFMPLDLGVTPEPTNPVETGLADLWVPTASTMTVDGRRSFRSAVESMTESWLWELANHIQHRIPDPIDYMEMRRRTYGSDLTRALARLAQGHSLPPEIYETRTLLGLENAVADYGFLINDVFSYQKEIEFEGELHNCVLVVQNFFNCDARTAVEIVNDLMTSRMRQFQHLVAVELPVLFDDFDLDAEARQTLTGYVEELRDWMAAILLWHTNCRRYVESELEHPPSMARPPGGPRGLGTATAAIASLLGGVPATQGSVV